MSEVEFPRMTRAEMFKACDWLDAKVQALTVYLSRISGEFGATEFYSEQLAVRDAYRKAVADMRECAHTGAEG